MNYAQDGAINRVLNELHRARENYPNFNSPHEGYALLQEEVEELWDEVKKRPKKRSLKRMRDEAVQVAAMAIRFITDCTQK